MAHVSEHHTEQEGENGNGVQSRVDFLVSGNTVSVDNFLEGSCESVGLDVGWVLCIWLHFSQRHKRRKNLVEQASLLLLNPNFADHNVVGFFKQVHGVENKRFFIEKHSKGFEPCASKILSLNSVL
jgi:hypothetical protein